MWRIIKAEGNAQEMTKYLGIVENVRFGEESERKERANENKHLRRRRIFRRNWFICGFLTVQNP